jgi:hypothetical protein
MNWERTTMSLEDLEEEKIGQVNVNSDMIDLIQKEEDNIKLQLFKNQDPATNFERQSLINLARRFSDLLVENKLEQIENELMADHAEGFVFHCSFEMYERLKYFIPEIENGMQTKKINLNELFN